MNIPGTLALLTRRGSDILGVPVLDGGDVTTEWG